MTKGARSLLLVAVSIVLGFSACSSATTGVVEEEAAVEGVAEEVVADAEEVAAVAEGVAEVAEEVAAAIETDPATADEEPSTTPEPAPLSRMTDDGAAALTAYLEEISRGWHQPSVDAANDILGDESLGPEAWETFFEDYFSGHPFTDDLRNYLGYPVYWWLSDTVHANLQQGIFSSLADIIVGQTEAYLEADRSFLVPASPVVQSIMNSHRFLNDMIHLQAPGADKRQDILDLYEALVTGEASAGPIYSTASIDVDEYPFAGAFRAQAQINYLDALTLSGQALNQLADTLGLAGTRRTVFQDYGVLVIDNQGLDETQLQVIVSVLESIPREMLRLTSITVNDFLGNTGEGYQWLLTKTGGVNVFGLAVGATTENGFPSDAMASYADVFSLVVVHELNHVVNASYVEKSDSLRERQETLLEQAGTDKMNYLRSMFEGDFFQGAPQEFFASISNQYFADSESTLLLGISRLQSGRSAPLNQFLFFADVYSLGGGSTLFYTLDTSGHLTTAEIPLVRNSDGRIEELSVGDTRYVFELDDDGNVVSATQG